MDQEFATKATYQPQVVVQTCCAPCSRRQGLEEPLLRSVASLGEQPAQSSLDISP